MDNQLIDLAFDILVNNWDRFPFLWRKDEGNVGNLLFMKNNDDSPVVGIDQHVTAIFLTGAGVQLHKEYFAKVNGVIEEIKRMKRSMHDKSQVPVLYSVVEYMREINHEINLGDEEFVLIVVGILQGISAIITKLTDSQIEEIYAKYEKEVLNLMERMTWGQDYMCRYGLFLVDPAFLIQLVNTFKGHAADLKAKEQELMST